MTDLWHTPIPGPLYWDFRCTVCSEPVADHPGWWARWRYRRRRRAWDAQCRKLRIPADVRERLVKMDPEFRHPPTWYAGRQDPP